MKRILLIILFLLALALTIIYFVLPDKFTISKVVYIKNNISSINRFLKNEDNLSKWWPEKYLSAPAGKENFYSFKTVSFRINKKMYNGLDITIKNRDITLNSHLYMIPLADDSMGIEWKAELPVTMNPLKKIAYYKYAGEVFNSMSDIMEKGKNIVEDNKNIYGIAVTQTMVTDTLLISAKYTSATYPPTTVIYSLLKEIKEYISRQGAAETNNPMLNVTKDSGFYRTMVAIPLNKTIPETKDLLLKKMFPGKILVTEVTGGVGTTAHVLKQLSDYMDDHRLSAPAKPFESLITDRSKEPDTTKWITRIYYPIY